MTTTDRGTERAWSAIATGYDEFVTPTHMWLGGEAVRRASIAAGMTFLDVAAGSGALSIPAARSGANVLATDLSPVMLRHLAERARAEGLTNVETRVMDGHVLDLPDDSFDRAGSQYGVMLFADLPRALRQMGRVVKPDGKVVIVAYGPPEEVEFLAIFLAAMKAVSPGFTGLPTDPVPLPFQVARREQLKGALEESGLREVVVETVTETLEFGSGAHMWDWVVNSNPIATGLTSDLTDDQEDLIREILDGMLRERAEGDRVARLTNPVNIAVGTK